MQTALHLPELLEKVAQQAAAKRDFVANTQSTMQVYQDRGDNLRLSLTNPDILETVNNFGINDTAHRQIATKLGIPVKYYLKLLHNHLIQLLDRLFH